MWKIRQGWHDLELKKLLALLRGIMPKYHEDFYCLNCLHSFATENKHESHKKVFESKVFCTAVMLSEETKILEFKLFN